MFELSILQFISSTLFQFINLPGHLLIAYCLLVTTDRTEIFHEDTQRDSVLYSVYLRGTTSQKKNRKSLQVASAFCNQPAWWRVNEEGQRFFDLSVFQFIRFSVYQFFDSLIFQCIRFTMIYACDWFTCVDIPHLDMGHPTANVPLLLPRVSRACCTHR